MSIVDGVVRIDWSHSAAEVFDSGFSSSAWSGTLMDGELFLLLVGWSYRP